jgi:uncharacterized membrane protein (DUF373 family)
VAYIVSHLEGDLCATAAVRSPSCAFTFGCEAFATMVESQTIRKQLQKDIASFQALDIYERFEQIVCLFLTALIALVIGVALYHLGTRILLLLIQDAIDPANQATFQTVFGMIMTVLIALEFNHSVLIMIKRHQNIVQVRTVVLIALFAVVRKFIVLDIAEAPPATMLGLATATLALGAVYWLIRDQDEKDEERRRRDSPQG